MKTVPTNAAQPTGAVIGQHVCALAADRATCERMAVAWVRDGLEAGERVTWIESPDGSRFRDWLDDHAVAWQEAEDRGQLGALPARMVLGVDSPDEITERLAHVSVMAQQSVADGYAGLRLWADVADALSVMPDVETQLRFEAAWEELTRREPVSLMCVYDPRTYGSRLADAVARHPRGLADRQAQVEARQDGVRLSGEIDLSNADLFGDLIDEAVSGGRPEVDLSELRFIDVRGTVRLVELSRTLGPGARLRVVGAPPALRAIVTVMGWDDDVELVDARAA